MINSPIQLNVKLKCAKLWKLNATKFNGFMVCKMASTNEPNEHKLHAIHKYLLFYRVAT